MHRVIIYYNFTSNKSLQFFMFVFVRIDGRLSAIFYTYGISDLSCKSRDWNSPNLVACLINYRRSRGIIKWIDTKSDKLYTRYSANCLFTVSFTIIYSNWRWGTISACKQVAYTMLLYYAISSLYFSQFSSITVLIVIVCNHQRRIVLYLLNILHNFGYTMRISALYFEI